MEAPTEGLGQGRYLAILCWQICWQVSWLGNPMAKCHLPSHEQGLFPPWIWWWPPEKQMSPPAWNTPWEHSHPSTWYIFLISPIPFRLCDNVTLYCGWQNCSWDKTEWFWLCFGLTKDSFFTPLRVKSLRTRYQQEPDMNTNTTDPSEDCWSTMCFKGSARGAGQACEGSRRSAAREAVGTPGFGAAEEEAMGIEMEELDYSGQVHLSLLQKVRGNEQTHAEYTQSWFPSLASEDSGWPGGAAGVSDSVAQSPKPSYLLSRIQWLSAVMPGSMASVLPENVKCQCQAYSILLWGWEAGAQTVWISQANCSARPMTLSSQISFEKTSNKQHLEWGGSNSKQRQLLSCVQVLAPTPTKQGPGSRKQGSSWRLFWKINARNKPRCIRAEMAALGLQGEYFRMMESLLPTAPASEDSPLALAEEWTWSGLCYNQHRWEMMHVC